MRTSLDDFRAFYQSRQGKLAASLISGVLQEFWGDAWSCSVASVGLPLDACNLKFYGACRAISLCPQGLTLPVWQGQGQGQGLCACARVEPDALPLPDRSIDRLVLFHALEHASCPRDLLRECWRVLCDSGSLVVIAPNRLGRWTRLPGFAFPGARGVSRDELAGLLRASLFEPVRDRHFLYCPPLGALASCAPRVERIGARIGGRIGGLLAVEAHKEMTLPVRVQECVRGGQRRRMIMGTPCTRRDLTP